MIEVELKSFRRDDFDRLMSWVNESPEFMMQWAGPAIFRYPLDRAQLEDYVKGSEDIQPHRMIFKAIYDNNVVGHIDLDKIDLQHRSASICRVLIGEPSLRGKGLATRMVRNVLEMAFDKLRLHRISLHVYDLNTAAIPLYERLGFVKEGHLRDVNKVENEFWSSYIMSILETEWRKMNPK